MNPTKYINEENNMKTKLNLRTVTATLSALVLFPIAGTASAISLNIGHTLAPESHYQVMAEKLAELIEEKSNGDISINTFPQSQLGGEVRMIQGVRTGTLDMLITAQAPLTGTIEEFSFFDIPYLFSSVEHANDSLAGELGDHFLDMLPEKNMIGLGWLSAMERNLFTSSAVNSASDVEGMKLRVMQSPGYVEAYEALDAMPTPMAYSDLYIALQQGVVDGGDTSPDQFVMDKFYEVSDFYSLTKVHYLPALLIMSKSRWDSLSEEQRGWLQESANEALAYGIDYYQQSYDDSIAQMKELGVTVVEPDIATLREETEEAREQLIKQVPEGERLYELIDKTALSKNAKG